MNPFRPLLLIAFASALCAQAPPDAAEQTRIIEALREAALAYDGNLPNFICTQVTRREVRAEPKDLAGVKAAPGGRGGSRSLNDVKSAQWEPVDSREEQLTYFSHRENYELLVLNGKPVAHGQTAPPGMTSSGEFGSTLSGIFDPRSHADFEWKRWDTLRSQPVYVFAYKIAKENSVSQLDAAGVRVVVGYHGLVFADRNTRQVMRVTTEAESPRNFPLRTVAKILDYGQAVIAGEHFLVPLHGEMEMRTSTDFMQHGRLGGNSPEVTLRNDTDFRAYRKYGVEATLKPE